jgi:hypothetical protein
LLPRWKGIHQKEEYIVKEIRKIFPVLDMKFDKVIDCRGCSKRRPDIFIDLFEYSIIIEIDEHQHSGYSCEKRTMEIFESLGNRPTVFIRFNPDRYNNTKGIFTYSKGGILKPTSFYTDRFKTLIETFNYHLNNPPLKEVTEILLFFDKLSPRET